MQPAVVFRPMEASRACAYAGPMGPEEGFGVAASRVLRVAQSIAGGPAELAHALGIEVALLNHWFATHAAPPHEVFDRALDIILNAYEQRSGPK